MGKPKIAKSFQVASKDMKSELKKLRKEQSNTNYFDWCSWENCTDVWVIGTDRLNSVEIRQLNKELGLTTTEGISQWYK